MVNFFRRNVRKLLIWVVILVSLGVISSFLIPPLNTLTKKGEFLIRTAKLFDWYNRINYIYTKEKRVPSSLYEVSLYEDLGGIKYPKVDVYGGSDRQRELVLMKDPNLFFQEVEYTLAIYHNGWFVVETKPGAKYKHRLMIDQNGKIYQVREVPEAEYEKSK